MTQHRPGDADLVINGERKILRLTLGALAELEETLGEGDLGTLQKRLEAPRVADLLVILKALLQGGGALVTIEALKASDLDLSAAARAIAKAFASLGGEETRA
ncbi:MAG: gene transfer agent family protein [Parvularculaceae bacterium]|nr:gene transfer agent family protein [Parvularculaceae bacterium]